jgi:1-acyl-sn-glycerol-3-phosphate acyltransferase
MSGLHYRASGTLLPRVERRRVFLGLARGYVRRKLKANFDGVYVAGLDEVQTLCRQRPVIFAPNHVAWWDAFLAVSLDEALGTEGYCLMDSRNLQRLSFFRWLGAIELSRGNQTDALRDLMQSLQLLSGPGRVLWVFPQGRQRPPHIRPLALQSGIALLAQQSRLPVVPVSISYSYLDAPRPRITVNFGHAIDPTDPGSDRPADGERAGSSWRRWLEGLETRLLTGLDANDRFILDSAGDYRPLLSAGRSSSDTPIGARLLTFFIGLRRRWATIWGAGAEREKAP